MRHGILWLLLAHFSFMVYGQDSKKQSDWQQRVAYTIDVTLNDVKHELSGSFKMVYTNNSPNALGEMYIHLWPNAYRDNTTDFALQQLINGKTEFYFAKENERGGIDDLSFKVDDKSVQWKLMDEQPDICLLTLNKAIPPGGSVVVTTPFNVRIPGSFSRFGHVDQDYQITQWYPKPAVYDVNGWNPVAYLDQGEFYSEFGSFEVRITVPENYVVAATGQLQEESEWKFIRKRKDKPLSVFDGIQSASETKTITFIQDSIHDFAWFASKYFNVEESSVVLKNGHRVSTFVYGPELELKHTKYIATALNYYSDNCGYYPYKYCTVVQGPIQAGGGMEYPMITVVSSLDEEVIVHEVGHNWFYGMLANNEGKYPWMDEAINTYFEGRAINGSTYTSSLDGTKFNPDKLNDQIMSHFADLTDRIRMNQAVGIGSKYFSGTNYGLMVYGKGSHMMGHLHAYVGEQIFFDCFKRYFEKWAFRHPLPDDIKSVFEEVSGLSLGWFFDDMINSDGILDYKVQSITPTQVLIENNGAISAPYPVGFYLNGELQIEVWQEGHLGVAPLALPTGFEFDLIKIDPYAVMAEENRQNNSMRKAGIARKIEPIKMTGFKVYENPNLTNIYVAPAVSWNIYDKWSLGLLLSNNNIPQPNFRYTLTPLYSFETQQLNGYANLSYRWYQNTALQRIEIGAKNARFTYQPYDQYSYNRLAPYAKFSFRNADKRMPDRTHLTLRYTHTSFNPQFDEAGMIADLAFDTNSFNRQAVIENSPDQFIDFTFERESNRALNPSSLRFNIQYGMVSDKIHKYDTLISAIGVSDRIDDFVRINLTLTKHLNYSLKNKGLDIRLFFGTYLKEPMEGLYQYRIGSQGGRYDYTFEKTALGRNMDDGTYRRQVLNNDMFIKQIGNFGNITGWTAAANLQSNLPGKIPLGLYLDLFTYKDYDIAVNNKEGDKIGYSGGISLQIVPKVFEIYVPFFNSIFITETQKHQKIEEFGQRITFMLDLNAIGKFSLEDALKGLF